MFEELGLLLFEQKADAVEIDGGVPVLFEIGAELQPVGVVPFTVVLGDEFLGETGLGKAG